MAGAKKKCNGQEKKKMAIKIDKVVGGSGIGAVILLAAAALASVFLVKEKRWNSTKNRRRQITPPPAANGLNNKKEQDEPGKGLHFILLDASSDLQKHPRNCRGAREVIDSQNDAALLISNRILTLDKKAWMEINGGTQGGVSNGENSEQILRTISPKRLEKDSISHPLQFGPKNQLHEVKIQLSKEDITNEISEESYDFERVYIEEQAEGERSGDQAGSGVMTVDNALDEVDSDHMDYAEKEGIYSSQESIFIDSSLSEGTASGSHSEEDEQEVLLPELHGLPTEHEKGYHEEIEVSLVAEILEIIQGDVEAIEEGQEDQIKHIEEKTVEEIIPEKCEEAGRMNEASLRVPRSELQTEGNNGGEIPSEKEETACIWNITTEKRDFGDYDNDVHILAVPMPEEELIPAEDTEATKDAANEEVAESLELNGNKSTVQFMEVEESSETIDTDTIKDDLIVETSEEEDQGENNINGYDDEFFSDEVEVSSVGTGDSNEGAVWPAELRESSMELQQVKLIYQELEGKIQEDRAIKEGKHDFQDSQRVVRNTYTELQVKEAGGKNSSGIFPDMADSTQFTDGKGNPGKTFTEKYVVQVTTLKDHSTYSTKLRMLMWALFVMSSLLFSWFFGLSCVAICLRFSS